jgi:hypothetical protein
MKMGDSEIAKQFLDLSYLNSVGKDTGNDSYAYVVCSAKKLVEFGNNRCWFIYNNNWDGLSHSV